jgi:hypothetical protein
MHLVLDDRSGALGTTAFITRRSVFLPSSDDDVSTFHASGPLSVGFTCICILRARAGRIGLNERF